MRAVFTTFGLCLVLALGLFCASCGGSASQPIDSGGSIWNAQLPSLGQLDELAGSGVVRSSSEVTLNLLASAPFDQVATGVTYSLGHLYLNSSVESPSWAVFRISGLGTDGEVYPVSVHINNTSGCWLGVSNYDRGCWQFSQVTWPGDYPVAGEAGLVNDAGSSYVLVLADTTIPHINSLSVTLNSGPGDAPTAQLNLVGMAVTEWNTGFNAEGSDPGGGSYTEFVYEFDGGSPLTVGAPDTIVEHMFTSVGAHTVKLTVRNDLGLEHAVLENIEVSEPNSDLLVIYNSSIPEDLDLADYYMSPQTGRGINPQHKMGLPLGAYSATVSRTNYESQIRAPVEEFILGHPAISGKICYLLLLKGMPHQIPGENEMNSALNPLRSTSTYSSVDSELCVLFSQPPAISFVWNAEDYEQFTPSTRSLYLQGTTGEMYPMLYYTIWRDPAWEYYELHTLDYLVGRLSAYTYDEAKLLVDRSLAASAPGANNWVVLDSCEDRRSADTMVDPVYPYVDDMDSGQELLTAAGINVFADVTTERITAESGLLPESFNNSVIGYAGWGVNHTGGSYAHGSEYILYDLGWNYAPGACFMSNESWNGTDFNSSDGITRRGQGQICDFIHQGGTVAIGYAYEPFIWGVADERWVLDRYLHHGDVWIEAAYKGLRLVSWQAIVVGDPLCRVQ